MPHYIFFFISERSIQIGAALSIIYHDLIIFLDIIRSNGKKIRFFDEFHYYKFWLSPMTVICLLLNKIRLELKGICHFTRKTPRGVWRLQLIERSRIPWHLIKYFSMHPIHMPTNSRLSSLHNYSEHSYHPHPQHSAVIAITIFPLFHANKPAHARKSYYQQNVTALSKETYLTTCSRRVVSFRIQWAYNPTHSHPTHKHIIIMRNFSIQSRQVRDGILSPIKC